MSATCPTCGWSGPPTQVVNGGCCPVCRDVPVVYTGQPLPDVSIRTVESFNKRALIALRGASLTPWDTGFVASIQSQVEHYEALDSTRQNTLYRMCNRHASSIHDKAVLSFAVCHARGAD